MSKTKSKQFFYCHNKNMFKSCLEMDLHREQLLLRQFLFDAQVAYFNKNFKISKFTDVGSFVFLTEQKNTRKVPTVLCNINRMSRSAR